MTTVRLCLAWLRRNLFWSNSLLSWQERLAAAGVLAGLALLLTLGRRLPLPLQAGLWTAGLLATALLFRASLLKLFGPVLWYDLIRAARRGKFIWLRCAYAGLLLFMLVTMFNGGRYQYTDDRTGSAQLAEDYFERFMFVQFLAVLLLTPAYVAGAIAEEKDRKTMEYILATDLRNHEIVLSKLASRLANLSLFLLTGLPILSVLQFAGGIDPDLVLVGFAATALTMLGLAGVSILMSTQSKKPRDAISLSYLFAMAYFLISGMSLVARVTWPGLMAWGFAPGWTVADLIAGFNSGNIFFALAEVKQAGAVGTLATVLPEILRRYALFMGAVTAVTVTWAVLRLRVIALRQSNAPARQPWLARAGFAARRPAVGGNPIVWKETVIERGVRLNWLGVILMTILFLLSMAPAVSMIWEHLIRPRPAWGYSYGPGGWLPSAMNMWVRTVGTLICSMTLLAVAVRASTCVSGERDRQTWDGLMTTPLEASEILYGKWLGCILSVRASWLWLGLVWLLGVVTGGLHPLAIGLLVVGWAVYAIFLALLGMYFSVVCRTSLRATLATLLSALLLAFGHWLIWMCCLFSPGMNGWEWLAKFQAGLTPPFALAMVAFSWHDLEHFGGGGPQVVEMIFFAAVGIGIWGVGALLLWSALLQRFCAATNRNLFWTPDRPRRYLPEPVTREATTPSPPDDRPPTKLTGAKLLDESWEPPRRPPEG